MIRNDEIIFFESLIPLISDTEKRNDLTELILKYKKNKSIVSSKVNEMNKGIGKERHCLNNKIFYLNNKKNKTTKDLLKLGLYIKQREEMNKKESRCLNE